MYNRVDGVFLLYQESYLMHQIFILKILCGKCFDVYVIIYLVFDKTVSGKTKKKS